MIAAEEANANGSITLGVTILKEPVSKLGVYLKIPLVVAICYNATVRCRFEIKESQKSRRQLATATAPLTMVGR
jgi:hypothetical protein